MKQGFSLIEMVVYVAIMAVTFVVIANISLSMTRSYKSLLATRDINNAAATGLETIARETRNASSVDLSGSTFNTNPGILKLNTVNNGSSSVVQFYVTNSVLMMDRDGVTQGPLTGSSVAVTNLQFQNLTSTSSQAIKINMTLAGGVGSTTQSENFYDTVIIRGSYK